MSKRNITDYFSQNKKTKTLEPQDFCRDTDSDELLTPTIKKWKNYFLWLYFDVQHYGALCYHLGIKVVLLLSEMFGKPQKTSSFSN
jgi:hypothetical protein